MDLARLRSFSKISLFVCSAIAISACGGGGGGDDSKTTPTPVPTATLAPPPVNTAPSISNILIVDDNAGDIQVGDILSVNYEYDDADGDLEDVHDYTWLRDGVVIAGAKNSTYTLTEADSGKNITVSMVPIAQSGKTTGSDSQSIGIVTGNVAPVASNAQILGGRNVSDTLTAIFDFSDADGDLPGDSLFQWMRNGSNISGATDNTYTTNIADGGQNISFRVSPVAQSGTGIGAEITASTITVNASPIAENVVIENGLQEPVLTAVVGETLAGSYRYTDAEGDFESGTQFRWLRNGTTEIATTANYTVVVADVDQSLSFEVTPFASVGSVNGNPVVSSLTNILNSAPTATNAIVTGSTNVNDTLTAHFDFNDIDGDLADTHLYQWTRNGSDISDATGRTYVTTVADNGEEIAFRVRPVSQTGMGIGSVINALPIIVNERPVAQSVVIESAAQEPAPTAIVGDILTGGYSYSDAEDDAESGTTLRWLRNGSIELATTASYTVVDADIDQTLSFEVTPNASAGSSNGVAEVSSVTRVLNSTPMAVNASITGGRNVSDTLSADFEFSDENGYSEGDSLYQWASNDSDIPGATNITYIIVTADSGKNITVKVRPVSEFGAEVGDEIFASAIIVNSIPVAENVVIENAGEEIAATAAVGETLTGGYRYSDTEDDAESGTSIRWLRNGTIEVATTVNYTVVVADLDQTLSFEVTPVAETGSINGLVVLSAETNIVNSAPTATNARIDGSNNVNDTFTALYDFNDVDGDLRGDGELSEDGVYQWTRNGEDIPGATDNTYTITTLDSGRNIAFSVRPVSQTGTEIGSEIFALAITVNAIPVAGNIVIENENEEPALTVTVGETLTGSYGYSDIEDDIEAGTTFRWLRGGDIELAATQSYTVVVADLGQALTFEVTPVAETGSINGVSVISSESNVVNSVPTATNVIITGTLNIGDTLEGGYAFDDVDGDIDSGSTFRWLRNGSIEVATTETYVLSLADAGQALVFEVTPRTASPASVGVLAKSEPLEIPMAYAVNYTVGDGGSLIGDSEQIIREGNDAILVTAQQNEGYTFDQWSDGLTTLSRVDTNITATINVNAGFTINTYTVAVSSNSGGSVSNASQIIEYGQAATIILTPDSGYVIQSVTGCAGALGGSTFITGVIAGNCTVYVFFAVEDAVPNSFLFADVTSSTVNEWVESETVVISGINTVIPVTMNGGEYRINSNPFTADATTLINGDSLTLRVTSSDDFNTVTTATVSVGGVAADFTVKTPNRPDYDLDDDGLVEINNLEDLNEIRNHLYGGGLYGSTNGCPVTSGCIGFELTTDLDFDTNSDGVIDAKDAYWNGGSGWLPLGDYSTNISFTAIFEGNGNQINNLYINRPSYGEQGLFGWTEGATLRNLVLSGRLAQVQGAYGVGSLVGFADHTTIQGIFSSAVIRSGGDSGGVIGYSANSRLRAVLYSGAVIGGEYNSGGLVGSSYYGTSIAGSYTTAVVRGGRSTGGLLGAGYDNVITASYWAIDTSGQSNSTDGGIGTTLSELQCPTAADDNVCASETLFEGWNSYTDDAGNPYWDFGASNELPALILNGRIYRDSDGDGVQDSDDAFPNDYAASLDADNDGYVDAWSVGCDNDCIVSSGFEYDNFPRSAAVALDYDLDGLADSWNPDCDADCQFESEITLDERLNDTDNDGLTNDVDEDVNGVPYADADSNGLLEIYTLAQLNAMRYNLAGRAMQTDDSGDDANNGGCPYGLVDGRPGFICLGYELMGDLDFDTNADGIMDGNDTYWNDGLGWLPIGSYGAASSFIAVFEGNGYWINNLYINRPSYSGQGLFGRIDGATLRNIALTGALSQVRGAYSVGSLVGFSTGSEVSGVFSSVAVGSDDEYGGDVGGVIGYMSGSSLRAVVNSGAVIARGYSVGGLAGSAYESSISGSYATAAVRGGSSSGGLVGGYSATVIESYWATDLSGQSYSEGGGAGATLAELQCPTASDDFECASETLFEGWYTYLDGSGNPYWDFGTANELPALVLNGRIYRDSDGDGVLDENDAFPNDYAASIDVDNDGFIDAWSAGCDSDCMEASGFEFDHFPGDVAVSQDYDLDGLADAWNADCDAVCQSSSGIILDESPNDTDNDGVTNDLDEDDNGVPYADSDSNGLLEVYTLAQLNSMRYNLSGRAMQTDDSGADANNGGCPYGFIGGQPGFVCVGYELMGDLDFDTNADGVMDANDTYWNAGLGWLPIGDFENHFAAIFEGHGYRINNLYINRPESSNQGLFGWAERAKLQNLALTGALAHVLGAYSVGSLVGGAANSEISGIYSAVIVRSYNYGGEIGGVVGLLSSSSMRAAVYSGEVIAGGYSVGGLAGRADNRSYISGSYSTAAVGGYDNYGFGGLLGEGSSNTVIESYWATDTSGQINSDGGGTGVTLAELQCPTSSDNSDCASEILFEGWDDYLDAAGNSYWDFGTESELPALVLSGRVYRDTDGDGVDDGSDAFPNSYAASLDADDDGYIDAWTSGCGTACIAASGFEFDHFPGSVAVAQDFDLDGLADAWNPSCDSACQSSSGITLDVLPNDTDNDGVNNNVDEDDNGVLNADADSDGLLDIRTLAQLDAIRYNLAGLAIQSDDTGFDANNSGCPYGFIDGQPGFVCSGYELMNDLEFDTNTDGVMDANDAYWNDGLGWLPLGSDNFDNQFTAIFEGNGYRINNLYINRPDTGDQGLFGATEGASLRNLALTGVLAQVQGYRSVGSLAGLAVETEVVGIFSSVIVRSDYRNGTRMGGVVGEARNSRLRAVVYTGAVIARGYSVGGIIGSAYEGNSIAGSYSTALVSGSGSSGGLVGGGYSATVIESYWATDTSGKINSEGGGTGVTLAELQCPTSSDNSDCASEILFEGWDAYLDASGNLYWDFGTESELPALVLSGRVYRDTDGDGVDDGSDAFPNSYAASLDADDDGYIDAWTSGCGTDCIAASGFEFDHFPDSVAVAQDFDLDGLADAWNPSCDSACQSLSGITLDVLPNDTDNDGVNNDVDEDDNGVLNADTDSDGLLDIRTLAQLDAIRYNLAGLAIQSDETGFDANSSGCPYGFVDGQPGFVCSGYELINNLEFDTNTDGVMDANDAYWNDGLGWLPLGRDNFDNQFTSIFEGNGYRINNLYINRPDTADQGLFGAIEGASLRNLALTGVLAQVQGYRNIGSLAGLAVETEVVGVFSSVIVRSDYPNGTRMGGVVGEARNSRLRAVVYAGAVIARGHSVGGIIGSAYEGNSIAGSYSTALVSGDGSSGGLVGGGYSATVIESYWATDTSGKINSEGGGTGVTIVELQCPTASDDSDCASEILFEGWGTYLDALGNPYWDFGTESELPALVLNGRVYRDSDGDGVEDGSDAFPNSYAASLDADDDGYVDAWTSGCDANCMSASGFEYDHFPSSAAVADDYDLDGLADAWNPACDSICQSTSGISLDALLNDTDNDGETNDLDDNDNGILHADADSDGLLDIRTLAQLDAIRYNLAGIAIQSDVTGFDANSTGCPYGFVDGQPGFVCSGYELMNDLDFDTNDDGVMDANDTYWNDGLGWLPLGQDYRFTAIFEGNGNRINNLYINRPDAYYQGLFGQTDKARLYNVALSGAVAQVRGDDYIGSLVGLAIDTSIVGVFSTVAVQADYIYGAYVGGVIGYSSNSSLRAVVYTGDVSTEGYLAAGGLVGGLRSNSSISGSYTTAAISGSNGSGGLLGYGSSYTVTESYWATDTSGQSDRVDGGIGVTLVELQCPTTSDDNSCASETLFEGWDAYIDDLGNPYWHFGSSRELPALVLNGRVYRDIDGDGALDGDDVFPNDYAASRDTDNDGYIDAWTAGCDNDCMADSGFEYDHFPESTAVAQDYDLDGLADAWNLGCDAICQSASGITLDTRPNDRDNDGLTNDVDEDVNGVPYADADSNGFLEIYTLVQLNSIRYNLEGRAIQSDDSGADANSGGCPYGFIDGQPDFVCSGYELMNDLDFDTNPDGVIDENDSYWNTGLGWLPLGSDNPGDRFAAIFEGNGNRINNLYINRPTDSYLGLFGHTEGATLRNVALTGVLAQVYGDRYVGSLAGIATESTITGVVSTVIVRSDYSYGASIGGLVGAARSSSLRAVVYSGAVIAEGYYTGGLVGAANDGVSSISGSYSTAAVKESSSFVGLLGGGYSNTVTESYWATDTSGQSNSEGGGTGVTLAELQCPTASDNSDCASETLFESWDTYLDRSGDPYWDFGTANELPALVLNGRVYRDTDGDGALDETDAFPNDYAASLDADADGYIDAWTAGCGNDCMADSGFEYDHFPASVSVAEDYDLDGLADSWNPDCESVCQSASGMSLDTLPNDTDNDGVINDLDEDDNGVLNADTDSDGLLDIRTLAQLDAMRYNFEGLEIQSDDTGFDANSSGCPYGFVDGQPGFVCSGYELMDDLDFDTNSDGVMDANDTYWNEGLGWLPVGSYEDDGRFSSIFEGNGNRIDNLYINRPDTSNQGFFGQTESATLQNIVLSGSLALVQGDSSMGSLVGRARDTEIVGVFSTVTVRTDHPDGSRIGGLVGSASGSHLRAVIHTGAVFTGGNYIGGLVGSGGATSSVAGSYAAAAVNGDVPSGGLVGSIYSSAVTESYWATDTSGQSISSGGGVGVTLAELQCPTASDDTICASVTLFENWDTYLDSSGNPYWDFGESNELPGLDLGGFIHRDSDGDGIMDLDDLTPHGE